MGNRREVTGRTLHGFVRFARCQASGSRAVAKLSGLSAVVVGRAVDGALPLALEVALRLELRAYVRPGVGERNWGRAELEAVVDLRSDSASDASSARVTVPSRSRPQSANHWARRLMPPSSPSGKPLKTDPRSRSSP